MNDQIEFDAIAWINDYFRGSVQLDFDHLRPILCFSLIWNLFETHACRRHATAESIRHSVDHADESGRLRRERYERYLGFFRSRYLTPDRTTDFFFDHLLLTERRAQEVVRRALHGESQDLNNHVYALLLIAHRVRNNLFHGNKKVESLPRQIDLFHTVNALLATYLEDIENLPARRQTSASSLPRARGGNSAAET